MLALFLSIVFSAVLLLLFKVFERRGIPVFQAIVFNYWTAALCGLLFLPDHWQLVNGEMTTREWLPLAIFLGMLFINVFNLTSITTLRFGVSTASVASKLGLVFPVILAFAVYHEGFNWLKGLGILFAFAAVILSSLKEKQASPTGHSKAMAFLPFIVFIGSGLCDSLSQYANKQHLMVKGIEEFSFILFLSAALTGTAILAWQLARKKASIHRNSIIGGIALGIPNYLAFSFLLKALATLSWGSSVVFPINNLGTVAFASLAGFLIFKERISKINLLGLGFAAVAIVLIILSNYY